MTDDGTFGADYVAWPEASRACPIGSIPLPEGIAHQCPREDFQWDSIYFTAMVTVLLVCPATVIVTGTALPTATVAGTVAFTWYNPA